MQTGQGDCLPRRRHSPPSGRRPLTLQASRVRLLRFLVPSGWVLSRCSSPTDSSVRASFDAPLRLVYESFKMRHLYRNWVARVGYCLDTEQGYFGFVPLPRVLSLWRYISTPCQRIFSTMAKKGPGFA